MVSFDTPASAVTGSVTVVTDTNAGAGISSVLAAAESSAGGSPETVTGLIPEFLTFTTLVAAAAAAQNGTVRVRQDSYLEKIGILVYDGTCTEMDISFDVEHLGNIQFTLQRALTMCHDLSDAAGEGKQPKNLGFFRSGHEITVSALNNNAGNNADVVFVFYFRPTK